MKLFKGKTKKVEDNYSKIIIKTFKDYGIKIKLEETKDGPAVLSFFFRLAKPEQLKGLYIFHNELALALGIHPIRINILDIEKGTIKVEVPKEDRKYLDLKESWKSKKFIKNKKNLSILIGKAKEDKDIFVDLSKNPHLLIGGMTGSGKSNFLHCIINSLMQNFNPNEVKFILVDNKRVEFNIYDGIPYLLTKPIVDTETTMGALLWLSEELEKRYRLLVDAEVKNIKEYNKKSKEKLPYIFFIEDEFADDMHANKEKFEEVIAKISQLGRIVGLQIILATSRPAKDVITPLIKANINSRLCFRVNSSIDSKEVIQMTGGEKMLGNGDALYSGLDHLPSIRVQVPYLSEDDLLENVERIKNTPYDLDFVTEDKSEEEDKVEEFEKTIKKF